MSVVDHLVRPRGDASEPANPASTTEIEIASAASADSRPGLRRFVSLQIVAPSVFLVLALTCWQLASMYLLDPKRQFLLPSPIDVVNDAFASRIIQEDLLTATKSTVLVAFTGFVIGALLAIGIAILMNLAKWIEATIYPYAVMVQTIPILALVPLIGFWIGFNFTSRVLVCVIITFFPIVTATLFGLKSAEPLLHDLVTIGGGSRWQRLVKLELPASLPAMFSGFRISAGGCVIGAIVADYFFRSGDPGLGRLLTTYLNNLQSAALFAAVIVSIALGIVVFWIVGWAEKRVIGRWSRTTAGAGRG